MRSSEAGGKKPIEEVEKLRARVAKLERISGKLTGHKNSDGQLDEAWHEWEKTFDATKDSIMLIDSEFKIIQANRATSRLLGMPLEEIVGKTCWQVVHGTEKPPKECPLKQTKYSKKHEETELYIPEKDIWLQVSMNPILDEQGDINRTVHILRDITERKKAEQLLEKERDRAQTYLDIAAVMLVAIDFEQRVGLINKKGCEILGYKEEEVLGKNWFDNFLPERIRDDVKTVFEKVVNGEFDAPECYENPILTKSGDERLFAWSNTVLRDEKGNVVATLSSGEDITERKKAEESLQKSENKYRELANSITDVFFAMDTDLRYTYWNKASEKLTGIKAEDALGKTIFEIFPDTEDIRKSVAVYRDVLKKKQPKNFESEYQLKGKHYFFEINAYPNKDGISVFVKDITERKRLEENLVEEQQELKRIIDSSPIIIFYKDIKGRFVRVNKGFAEALKIPEEEFLGKTVFDFYSAEIAQGMTDDDQEVLKSGRTKLKIIEKYESATGIRWVQTDKVPIFDKRGIPVGLIGFAQDITERKKAEDKLVEDQAKLKAMASKIILTEERERRHLAVGLHDNICQRLVLTKLALESSLKSVSDSNVLASLKNACREIGETIREAESLTFELSNPILREFGFVAALEKYLAEEIQQKHGITYELERDKQIGTLHDEIKTCLFRVTRELLTNIVKHAHARKIKVSVHKNRGQIYVHIQDDGVGFKDTQVGSQVSKAARFGLFSVREQLEYVGGHFGIESQPGRGTTVTVVLPLKKKATL